MTPSTVRPIGQITFAGTGLHGDSEGSSGGTNDSSTAFPLLRIQRIEGERSLWLPLDPAAAWSAASVPSATFNGLPLGHYRATLFADVLPCESVEGGGGLVLGRFAEFARTLFDRLGRLEARRSVGSGVWPGAPNPLVSGAGAERTLGTELQTRRSSGHPPCAIVLIVRSAALMT